MTHANAAAQPLWGEAKSLHWKSDGFRVQGWLIYPEQLRCQRKKYPMVVAVHGGPASSMKPAWPRPGFNPTLLSQQGYFVLLPNPRGSYGQGEKFTAANVKDFGGGDLRDILAGVDEAIRTAPIDAQPRRHHRLELWRLHDHVGRDADQPLPRRGGRRRHRQLAELLRRELHRPWMMPYFGASVYDDPAVYAKSSPIDFIKNVKTPTLVVVGDRDGECPAAAILRILARAQDAGREDRDGGLSQRRPPVPQPADQRDVLVRMIGWFNENLR